MTALADTGAAPRGLPSLREIGLWAGAALVMLVAHAAIAYAVHAFQPAEPPPEAAEPALTIDLTPLTISAPEAIESETAAQERPDDVVQPVETAELARNALQPETIKADTPERAEPEAAEALQPEVETPDPQPIETAEAVEPEVTSETTAAEPVETMKAQAAKPEIAEPLTPDVTSPTVQPDKPEPEITEPEPVEPTAPEIVTAVTPEVVLPVPEPRPVAKEEPEKKPKVKKAETRTAAVRKSAEKKRPEGAKSAEKKKVAKAEASSAPKSKASAESRASKAPTVSPARWQSKVVAWLNRHKRYPSGAKSRREQGMVRVAFAINASGSVLSVRVTRSSGNAELDKAALDMVRRASPVPAPPPGIARSRMSLAVPVQFSLR